MADNDLSSPEHRLDNLSKGKFFRAYAELHAIALDSRWRDKPISDLAVVVEVIDAQLAQMFDVSVMSLRNMLTAAVDPNLVFKTGQEQAGFPTA